MGGGDASQGLPDAEAPDPVIALQSALAATGYRDRAGGRRRWVLLQRAKSLAADGLTAELVPELCRLAAGGQDPAGLFAHWLDGGLWREVLDEQASRMKHESARRRHSDARREQA